MWKNSRCHFSYWYSIIGHEVWRNCLAPWSASPSEYYRCIQLYAWAFPGNFRRKRPNAYVRDRLVLSNFWNFWNLSGKKTKRKAGKYHSKGRFSLYTENKMCSEWTRSFFNKILWQIAVLREIASLVSMHAPHIYGLFSCNVLTQLSKSSVSTSLSLQSFLHQKIPCSQKDNS